MIKIVGFGCILAGCTGLGLCLYYSLIERIREIHVVADILKTFEQEIHYHRSTFQEACKIVKDRVPKPYNELLDYTSGATELSTGKSFGEVWKSKMEQIKDKLTIPEQVYSILYTLFDNCYVNPETQMEHLIQSRMEIEKILQTEESEEKNKGKMYVCLGTAAGVLGIIILL